jgi:hypothetical protein
VYPNTFPPAGNTSGAIKRYYTITPSGSFSAEKLSLAFDRATENPHGVPLLSMVLFRNSSGTLWTNVGGYPSGNDPNVHHSVFLGYVSQWSNWAIGDGNQPLPIQLASFGAMRMQNGFVRLDWMTLSETNNYGFEVQRSADSTSSFTTVPNSFIAGHGTTTEPHRYFFVDSTATSARLWYRLKQIDLDGTLRYTDAITVEALTVVAEKPLPKEYGLSQNYPNPFNPTTTIKYQLPANSYVTLKVYDIAGRQVAVLVNGTIEAGYHETRFEAKDLAGGVYLYRLKADNFVATKKLIVLR